MSSDHGLATLRGAIATLYAVHGTDR